MSSFKITSSILLLLLTISGSFAQLRNISGLEYELGNTTIFYQGKVALKNDNLAEYMKVGLHAIKFSGTSNINCTAQFFLEMDNGSRYPLSSEIKISDANFSWGIRSQLIEVDLMFLGSSKKGKIILTHTERKPDGSNHPIVVNDRTYLTTTDAPTPSLINQPIAWANMNPGKFVQINGRELSTYTVIRPSDNHFLNSHTNSQIRSSGGKISMTMQLDGNLVISEVATGRVVWASNSDDKNRRPGDRFAAIFQLDGNIVVYRSDSTGRFTIPIWSSQTTATGSGRSENVIYGFLALQDDGNFVLYFPRYNTIDHYNVIRSTNSYGIVSPHFGQMK
ncbi:hypothetical protein M8998_07200 [Sphingobacterium sp. lm-10]|uniref:hypothetical protein n=1 Tax=Sphingobacterium sp. lm-10 TaxID=2944904 RepID=UPI002020A262|nr:hypothetical protein [Sphingobacterium sp. lm-10]MCL7987720.1 hypothetical protein [Sphingobacterium sp. lm-10]